MPQAKALSIDPTLSSKGYSTLLWEALAGHLLTKPPKEEVLPWAGPEATLSSACDSDKGHMRIRGLLSH